MPTPKKGHISPVDAEDANVNAHAVDDEMLITDEELSVSGNTEQITLWVDKEALARWRATGKGWQTRAAAVLAAHAP